ncbi:hypothetical protein [Thalassobaculum sp.]|uniref:hypothetical protein n=1 Tax=Thalassobaculum sp. TaxID=2022740 RepID=UPI0032EE9D75
MRLDICCVGNRFNMYRNVIALLYHALVDAGHDVTVSQNRVTTDALTIIVPPMAFRVPELVEALAGRRARYLVLGVETLGGIAHGAGPEAPDDREPFRRFFGNAAGVLCLFREDLESYRTVTPRPVYMRYGCHPAVAEIPDAAERPVDVFFFGDVDPYPARARVLQQLREAGLAVDVLAGSSHAPHELLRNARIGRSKIDLNLAHADHVSPQRVVYLANNRRCCVSNTVPDPDGYLAATSAFPDDAALVDACRAIVADGSWRARGEEAYERVRGWGMTGIVTAALDEVLAGDGAGASLLAGNR